MFSLSDEQRALLALHLISGIGPRILQNLLQRFGSAQAVLQASAAELATVPHIGDGTARKFRDALSSIDVAGEEARLQQYNVQLRFLSEPDYPATLATIPVPPPVLYLRGTLEPVDRQAIAIVGSRSCTAYGRRVSERLAQDLARAGYTIISGLARGIDGAAHRGALQAGGRTIAVLAGGLASIYPPEHRELAEQVAAAGALISEAHMQMTPLPDLFPRRNRIISGLARAVVVVEANARSGALLTAEHALEQGREVFAVPGAVDSAASEGTLQLLRDRARLVRHADDILDDLRGVAALVAAPQGELPFEPYPQVHNTAAEPPPGLDEVQRNIWDLLGNGARHQDEIVQELGMAVAQLSGALLLLEMKKVIHRLPGNRYERC